VKSRGLAALLTASLLVALGLAGGQALAATKGPTLKSLVRQTSALPRAAVSKAKKRKLVRVAKHARRVAKKRPCVAVRDLARYRRVLGGVKVPKGKRKRARRARNRLAALAPASLSVSKGLLARKGTKRCGGGVKPSTRATTRTTLIRNDVNGMQLKVDLPAVQFLPRTGGGQTWSELKLPQTDTPSAPGTPGIPVASSSFGIPQGATLEVKPGKTESITLQGVDVFPAQPDPLDQAAPPPDFSDPPFVDAPFTLNRNAYGSDRFFPSSAAGGQPLGAYRDLTIGGLQVPAGRYNPAERELQVFKSVVVNVNFAGGSHTFDPQISSPWEHPARQVIATLLNREVVLQPGSFPLPRCGEEMLVITHPDTRAAADQFANAKRAQGMRTRVSEVGTASGQIGATATEIQTYIRERLTQVGCIHPSYVTIMGDDDLVPTFTDTPLSIPSDLPYAARDDNDALPDVAVGRFIGNDNAAISTAVTKVVNYENSPPSGLWLSRATVAAEFEDTDRNGTEDRTFTYFAETLRNGLVGRGVDVDRIYADDPTTTPLKLADGTDVPNALKKPAFAWNGDSADISAAWNQGRFLMVHRDHGWNDGWWEPRFVTGDVQALSNGALLPVVMSINCSSAAYDYDETSFVGESLVNPNGGSVGVFGDTRDSPSWHNTQIALGFADALLPSVLPAEGGDTGQRVGNALIAGKLRLAGLSSPTTDGASQREMYLWHYFGDPSMQMWGGGRAPTELNVAEIRPVYARSDEPGADPPYRVDVTLPRSLQGQPISLMRDGEVIGKSGIGNGGASIRPSFGDGTDLGDLRVAIDADGARPISVPVEGVTALSRSCPSQVVQSNGSMVTFGRLTPGVTGAQIRLTYTRPDGTTFERTAQVHPDGSWNDSISPNAEDPNGLGNGTWRIRMRYAGDASHAPSTVPDCTASVVEQGTSLTQTCPEEVANDGSHVGAFGTLSPGGDIANIVVKYTRPDGTTFERTTQTDGNGNWSDSLDPEVGGVWKLQARFDGDGNRAGSTAPECSMNVAPQT
jgi:hypothetical protein